MKLYLSSYRIPTPKDFSDLIGKKPQQTKLAVIPNAKDYYAKRARDYKIGAVLDFLKDLGYATELVDLRDYEQYTLKIKLQNSDALWVSGGNTFCLRYEMKRSGFENIIEELLDRGLVYGGESAGAIVVGPTLKGVELADEPAFAEEELYQGLKIVENLIIPHADNLTFGAAIKDMIKKYQNNSKAVILNDDQAYIFDGAKKTISTG